MTRRQRRKRQRQRRRDAGPRRALHTRHSLITGAGLTAGAVLGVASPASAANYYVTNLNSSGSGSLADAMTMANNGNGPTRDDIIFQAGLTGTITLGADLTTVDEPLGIYGPGANIGGKASTLTISGGGAHRIFKVTAGGNLVVAGLTLANGYAAGMGGAIYDSGGRVGVYQSTIAGSTAGVDGGAIYSVGGTVVLESSTITGNTPDGVRTRYDADGVYTSTVSGNHGRGLFPSHSTHFYVSDSTVAGNTGGALYEYLDAKVYLFSSVFAGSQPSPDLYGGSNVTYVDYSLVQSQGPGTFNSAHTIFNTDPQLGPLADNGGPTPTQRPSNTSPLLDQGRQKGFDQRHLPRPFDIASIPNSATLTGAGADIGAVELQAAELVAPPSSPPSTSGPGTHAKKCKKRKKHSARAAKKCKKRKKR